MIVLTLANVDATRTDTGAPRPDRSFLAFDSGTVTTQSRTSVRGDVDGGPSGSAETRHRDR